MHWPVELILVIPASVTLISISPCGSVMLSMSVVCGAVEPVRPITKVSGYCSLERHAQMSTCFQQQLRHWRDCVGKRPLFTYTKKTGLLIPAL